MENSRQKMEKDLLRRVRGAQGYGGFFAGVSPISAARTRTCSAKPSLILGALGCCMGSCFG